MAKRVLIVEDDHNLIHFYNMVCENFNDSIEIIEATSGDQAISLFQNDENFTVDLIISDYKMDHGDGLKLYQFLRHRYSDIPFLVVSGNDNGEFTKNETFARCSTNHYIPKPVREPDIRNILELYIDENTSYDPEDISDNYKKVNTVFFLRFTQTHCDIYIKLSNKKFIKLYCKEGEFDTAHITHYLNKDVNHLYLTNEDYEKFKVSMAETPFLAGVEGDEEANSSYETTQAVFSALLQTYGISELLIKKGFEKIINTKERISSSAELVKIFDIRQLSHSFYSDHSLMVALLACLTIEKMDWRSDENAEKLCMAAVLHDSILSEEVVNVMESGNFEKFEFISDEQKSEYFSHPQKVAEMIRNSTSLHDEIASIISEHHEKPDGTGFPRKLTYQNIHPLSAIFIVVHDFVEQLYLTQFDGDLRSTIMDNLEEKYHQGHFLSVMNAFREVLSPMDDDDQNFEDDIGNMDTMS